MADSLVVKGQEYSWVRYVKSRIAKNKNFLAVLVGQTGSGKSWSGLSICELLDKDFCVDQVIFKGSELLTLINSGKLKSGSAILWDEAGIDLSSKNWQSTTNKLLNFLFQTFRSKNYILIFTTPFSTFVDKSSRKLFHAMFETQGIDFQEKKVKIKPKLLQYNPSNDRTYMKYLRVSDRKGVTPIVFWSVPKPSDSLIEAYEKKKLEFTTKLNQKISQELNQIERDAEPLEESPEIKRPEGLRLGSMQFDIYKEASKGYKTIEELRQRLEVVLKRSIHSFQLRTNIHSMIKRGVDIEKFKLSN